MAGNTFGKIFTLTSFGESHGAALGGIIDGCPSGLKVDFDFIQNELNRRKPGQSKIVTQRKEEDKVEFLSGIYEGKTTGTSIGFIIQNKDQKSNHYDHLKDVFRPSHADFTYNEKYGHRDHRGGGRSSARETAVRVVAGAIAKLILKKYKISVDAYVSSVGDIFLEKEYTELNLKKIESNEIRCPDEKTAKLMIEKILQVRKEGDSIGGVISCIIKNTPVGLGEPVFDKLHANLGQAMLGINAVKGFEYGSGFAGTFMQGSQHNDIFSKKGNKVITLTNHSGGIQGGISNGMDIYFRVAFKPVATIIMDQDTLSSNGKKSIVRGKGRHDPCVLPRAVPIVEAMSALVLVDHLLLNQLSKLK
jgi:chorismate synthase